MIRDLLFDDEGNGSVSLEQMLERFEAAWKQGERPRIDDYLPPPSDSRTPVLIELVHTDLEYRLRAGDAVGVEEYWQRYPELQDDSRIALELIAAEFELCDRYCGAVSLADYLHRFPQFADVLPNQLATLPVRGDAADRARERLPLQIGDRFGKFELLALVGSGSFGVVYRARDTEMGRVVALKVPRAGSLLAWRTEERFLREAHGAGRLSHPGIIAIHEAGQIHGLCYLVSEFVDGPTLAQHLTSGRPGIRRSAELAAQIAAALHYAHEHGVIHRDLKPANILLSMQNAECRMQNEKPADPSFCILHSAFCIPKIADFGLARAEQEEATLTGTGELLGTPAYMSPEQARGEARWVDARTDVYSLGVILYEMLTGELPFRGSNQQVLRQVLEEEPRPPRRLNEAIPRDLETVCLKALAKEPAARYRSAAALGDDLQRFLSSLPVLARPVGWAGKLGRWARRKPVVAGLTAALLLVAALGLGGVLAAWRQAVAERAEVERQRAEARADFQRAHQALTELIEHSLYPAADSPLPRQPILEKSLAYYQHFLRQHDDDPRLAVETAHAHMRLGAILRAMCNPASRESYAQAAARWEQLAQSQPDELEYQANAVKCWLFQGDADRSEQAEANRACFRRALLGAESLVAAGPADKEFRLLLASAHFDLGILEEQQGRRAEAVGRFAEARAAAERLRRQEPTVTEYQVLLGETCYHLATLLRESGREPEAFAAYQQGLEIWCAMIRATLEVRPDGGRCYWHSAFYYEQHQPLARAGTSLTSVRAYLSKSYFWVAALLDRRGQSPAALDSFRLAAEQFRHLMEKLPSRASYQRDLAACLHNIGNLQREAGRLEDAAQSYREALALRTRLVHDYPDNAGYRSDLRGTQRKLHGILLLRELPFVPALDRAERRAQ
jgi:tetratricopeptide (TPR) repeat protein